MKYSWILLLILAFAACEKPKAPEFKDVKNLRVTNITTKEVVLKGDANLYNPNDFTINVDQLNLDVYLNDEFVGNVIEDAEALVSPKADFTVSLNARVPIRNLSKEYLTNIVTTMAKNKLKVRYEGYIVIRALSADIKVPIEYEEMIGIRKNL